jgi:hypothetical protein
MDKIAKAIMGAVAAGVGTLVTAQLDDAITVIEYVLIGAATVTAFFAVWATSNAPAEGSK